MDIRQLRYFVAIVERGSFSKAAAHLHVAQPALSQHVRHMEEELGVALLHRGTHGVVATEAGDRLLLHARNILAEFSEIRDSVGAAQASPKGEVRFGLPGTVSEILGVPIIEQARKRYPEVRIRIVEAMSGYILEWLKRGEVDLAVIYGTADPKGLAFHHGLSEDLCLFGLPKLGAVKAPPGGAVTLAKAAELDLILPGLSHGLRDLVERAAQSAGVVIRPSVEVDSYSSIKRLALRGLGYGILPETAIRQEVETGALAAWRFANTALERNVYLAYSTERPLPLPARAVGSLCWTILRQLVRDKVWAARLTDDSNAPGFLMNDRK